MHIINHKGKQADAMLRVELARCVAKFGEYAVASECGISPHTLARYLGGLTAYGGTHAAVRAYLERTRLAA